MFNVALKEEALAIHKRAVERYNLSHKKMMEESSKLYKTRIMTIKLTKEIEEFINSIANTPKDFEIEMGLIKDEIERFRETESYAKEALDNEKKAGANAVGAIVVGGALAEIAPRVAMQIATTFGKASTGIAIQELSGIAAEKAALAWLGGGTIAAGGAGIAGGESLLALAGPIIGWSIVGAEVGVGLMSMTKKNKKISDKAVEEAKEIMKARENLDEMIKKIEDLNKKTNMLFEPLQKQLHSLIYLKNADFTTLEDEEIFYLGTIVNNTLAMVGLINCTVK